MSENLTVLDFPDALYESRGMMIPVKLKLSEEGITFRNSKTGKVETIKSDAIEVLNWQRLAGGWGVRTFTGDGTLYRFGGFKESDQSKLEKFFKQTMKKTMSEKEFSVKGWNYGAAKFEGSVLSFDVDGKPAFEVPVNNVSACTTGKNEITMEYHQHEEAAVHMLEMRFHIPASELEGDEDPVESFKNRVMSKASIITATGDAIAIFSEIQCLTPRGRYDIKVYPTFIQLHGKTFDFKIPNTTVLRLFLLPHMDQRQHFFVISLDPPIKQGQTRYPYVILLFSGDDPETIELPLEEEELKEKYGGRMEKEMTGPQYEIIGRIFKGVCEKKIITPGNFVGATQTPAVGCSYKAAAGYLYPLERGLIYVHKPPLHIRFDEITSVNFARSGSTTRSFDFEIEVKNSQVHTFSSIDKGEYNRLFEYANSRKLRIKNKGGNIAGGRADNMSGSDNEPDHYMSRVRAEAQEREDDDEDDDMSSDDEEFNPDADGGSDAEVAEEYDSNAPDSTDESDSDESGSEKKKKKKEKKSPKPKKARTVSEKPRKQRTTKKGKKKDPNAPKRPMSAYFLWLNENRDQIKKDNPDFAITEISKKAGELWRGLEDKSKWEKMQVKAKEEYEEKMAAYKASGGGQDADSDADDEDDKPKKAKKAKTPRKSTGSPTKTGSGGNFKSAEFVPDDSSDDDDDGSDDDDDDKKKKPKKEEESDEEESGSGSD